MTITSYHKEEWSPAWSMRTMMEAIIAHFVVEDNGIGSLHDSPSMRKEYAQKSSEYKCAQCGDIKNIAEKFLK